MEDFKKLNSNIYLKLEEIYTLTFDFENIYVVFNETNKVIRVINQEVIKECFPEIKEIIANTFNCREQKSDYILKKLHNFNLLEGNYGY